MKSISRRDMFCFLAALLPVVFARTVHADNCPFSETCSIDGQMMMQEATYYNGIHKSVKYGHDYYGANGKEHHYVVVECD
ncbi:MAG: hypothetical protein ACLQLH_17215 [Terracidiphilus sp.]